VRHAVGFVTETREEEVAGEVVDGLPVLAASRELDQPAPIGRQVAALAATGFVAGAATIALAHRRRSRVTARRLRKKRGAIGEIVATNSFLVDVHLIKRS